jgi:diguanylate cyclase (GGDEF)-like protein
MSASPSGLVPAETALRSWATEQLAAFLGAVTAESDESAAVRAAVERIAETLEAEVAAVTSASGVEASCGFPMGRVPTDAVLEVADGARKTLDVHGIGPCESFAVPIEDERLHCLVVGRAGSTLDTEELGLLRAMARVLTMSLRTIRALEAERTLRARSEHQQAENVRLLTILREREELLARLSRIQKSIVSRNALEDVIDTIVSGAAELLQDEVVGLRLLKEDDPTQWEMVATRGVPETMLDATREGLVGEGCGGRAIAEGRLIVVEDYEHDGSSLSAFIDDGVRAAMAAPVRERGEVVGSLVVATHAAGRRYSQAEREILLAFAEHVSLALNDARAVSDAIHQAFHDSLTGLPNRSLLLDRLRQALARSQRSGAQVGLMFCDLDDFKMINDSLGHAAGDELLVAVGRRFAGCIRPGDTAARFGGDEFVLLFEELDRREVTRPAERILEALRRPFKIRGRDVVVGVSIGIAAGNDTAEDMLRNADLALYRAKAAGKGRFEVFEPRMHTQMVERLELEGDLRLALRRNELRLAYQPIVRLVDGQTTGVEALVRWQHPERGLLRPDEFIPIAEDSRLVVPLGRWVLQEACRQAMVWQAALPSGGAPVVSVNLSGVELAQNDLAGYVESVLKETGLSASTLMLELTETALVQDTELAKTRLGELRSLGVRLAVDDFGTGYASLQHLRSFEVDVIKIAKPFVDGVAGRSEESALARAIIDLGASFRLGVVAEGIETPAQRERLLALGCDLGQGYLFAKPASASELTPSLVGAPSVASALGPRAA